jgi:hypothetical protein
MKTKMPIYLHHLLCDEKGLYSVESNVLEKVILKAESQYDTLKAALFEVRK